MSVAVLTKTEQAIGTFGPYLGEILKTEGFVDFELVPVRGSAADAIAGLDRYAAVVLTRLNLSKAQVDALVAYVHRGGRLVAIRPQLLLAQALGLRSGLSMTDRAYVRPVAGHPIGDGVPHEPIQTHLPADNYLPGRPNQQTIAELCGDATARTAFPAIVQLSHGDGVAVVFSYDLPLAVSRIRQGDPDRVGGRALGNGTQSRTQDLLLGYADPACWHLPQADIHAMLLGNAINAVAAEPQPRWWYFPTPDLKSVLVLDSDDDWSAPEAFDALIDTVEKYDGHITVYLMLNPSQRTIATKELVAAWRARGHSFGVHHNPYDEVYGGADEEEVLEGVVRAELADFVETYGELPLANRNHCAAWSGYVDLPKLYEELGIVLDLNTMSNGAAWLRYLNGSARPMRFVDVDGRVINVFQQLTEAYDDLSVKARLSTNPAAEAAATRALMEERIRTYFSPLSMLSHPVSFHTYSREYQERCWSAARELGMPIWSAAEWAAFTQARDTAMMSGVTRDTGGFRATVTGTSPAGSLTVMLPVPAANVDQALVDGEPVDVVAQRAFGWDYTLVRVALHPTRQQSRTVEMRTTA